MGQENNNSTPNGQAPSGENPQGQAPATTSSGQASQENPEQQTPEQKLIAELRAENAKHRNKANEQASLARQAEEQRLKEQGDYKLLAEQKEARIKELEPVQAENEKLSDIVHDLVKELTTSWPEEVTALVPNKSASALERMAAVKKFRPFAEKLATQARGQTPGNVPNPKPDTNPGTVNVNDAMQKLLGSKTYF